jgi:DNA topoisomerase-1
MSIDINSEDNRNTFRTSGSTMIFDGFYKLYKDEDSQDDKEEQKLPQVVEKEKLKLEQVNPEQHFTQPPPRYTEASLVKKMEELGIGRPSTYPTIISILQDRQYVKIEAKRFFPETKGRLVNAFLTRFFTQYVEYDFTAKLEDELDDISNGTIDWKQVLNGFWRPFKSKTDEVMEIKRTDVTAAIEKYMNDYIFEGQDKNDKGESICPDCKTGTLHLKTGKFGAFVGCSNYPTCKHINNIGHQMKEEDQSEANGSFPITLGNDPDGAEISIRKGPYGIYVQKTHGKDIKRMGLPKGVNFEQVNLERALSLLALPRILGNHPTDNIKVTAGIGRFGPYVEHNRVYKSLKIDDPLTITLERALEILAQPASPRGFKRKTASEAATSKPATSKKPVASKSKAKSKASKPAKKVKK